MRCPKCHIEVEKGNLYCPNCLTEIPWVKEFNSVETLLEKQKRENTRILPQVEIAFPPRHSKSRLLKIGLVCCTLFVAFLCAFFYLRSQSFEALYHQSTSAYKEKDYEMASEYAQRALEKRPDSLSANLLLAKILGKQGDTTSAIKLLEPMILRYTESDRAYKMLILFLDREGRKSEIKKILRKCQSQKVLEACKDYVCEDPVSSLPPGTYTTAQKVTLSADYDDIYYTLDGSLPSKGSHKYSGPILLPEGTTVLKALGINAKGISSDVIIRKYILVLKAPDAPEVSPESGDYNKDTKITLKVPDGCRAYYAFDKVPTAQSTEYVRPIAMPQGSHVFYCLLIAANGQTSEVTSKEYYLQY